MTLLDVHHFTKDFTIHHLNRKVKVFENLSLALNAGEFLLITGANGAGKSTLLRCLYRSYVPTQGAAYYHSRHGVIDLARAADVDIAQLRREEIGFVTQFLHLRPRVSALEWVAEPLLAAGLAPEIAQGEAGVWLEAFDLKPDIWPAYPTTFSGGEQQKVNLARALIAPRRLLLLDEPTASLDARTRAALVKRLGQLKDQGVAMIGVFHHPEDVHRLVDKEVRLGQTNGVAPVLAEEAVYVAQ